MGYNDEKSTKPREMVHRAQAECATALHQLRLSQHDAGAGVDQETAEKRLHAAVMLYWEQIKRFSNEARIDEHWNDETAIETVDSEYTLDELRDRRLTHQSRAVQRTDPETNATTTELEQTPWRLSPKQALSVYDKLDECANALGFDARPQRDARETGTARTTGEDTSAAEGDVEHLNSEVEL